MSNYTTGELAKRCGVSVRTVQYYDTRGLLPPSQLSEGGRRLYSEDDLRKLQLICFLRSVDLPISTISRLFSEPDPGSIVSLLLEQQARSLRAELQERQDKLQTLERLQRELKTLDHFSVESIGDIAYQMEHRKKLRKVRRVILSVGILMELIEVATAILWIRSGIWQPFAIGMVPVVLLGVWVSRYYLKNVAYICPRCHAVFRPGGKEAFFAPHTPTTRRLTCPHCGRKGFCVETGAPPEPPAKGSATGR